MRPPTGVVRAMFAALAAGCADPTALERAVAPLAASPTGAHPGAPASRRPPEEREAAGAIRLTLAWPPRAALFLPIGIETFEVGVHPDASAPALKSASASRPSGGGPSVLVIADIPGGDYVIKCLARDALGAEIASGETAVRVAPNALTAASVTLDATERPEIAGLSAAITLPGELLTITGKGFRLDSLANYTVSIAGATVPPFQVFSPDRGRLIATVPKAAGRGPVEVAVGPYLATSAVDFVAVASVSLSPAARDLAPGESFQFTATAFDASGSLLAGAKIPWGMENETCTGNGCEDFDSAKVKDGLVVGELDVGDFAIQPDGSRVRVSPPGTVVAWGTLVAGNLVLRATASIRIVIPGN